MSWQEHERRIKALEDARKELEDAFVVMTHLETKQSNVIKTLVQQTDEQRRRQEEYDRHREEQRKLNEDTDKRIAALVSAIGELISKQNRWQ